MIKKYTIVLVLALAAACTTETEETQTGQGEVTKESLAESIAQMEDSLTRLQNVEPLTAQLTQIDYINRLLDYYRNFPEDKEMAALCLDKAHMVYSGIGAVQKSIDWADTLLIKYPEYKNRAMILESQASSYDALLDPRDSAKVREYYTLLLKEYPNLEKEKKEGIEQRLRYNHLNFDAYIDKVAAEQMQIP